MSEVAVFDALKYRIEVDGLGTRRYFNNAGELHRTGGPAIEWYNGDIEWFQNGQRHRIDGVAIEWGDGTKSWWQNGRLHRTDGPAIEYSDGYKRWFIYDVEMTEDEFNQAIKLL